jgi:hypothetical protein
MLFIADKTPKFGDASLYLSYNEASPYLRAKIFGKTGVLCGYGFGSGVSFRGLFTTVCQLKKATDK